MHSRFMVMDTWSSWSPERRRSAVRWPSEHAVLARVTVGDASAFHCGVCSLPLEPPIFQCALGLAVCSACRGPGYRRCRAVENILDTVRVSCPHAAHGCGAMLAYYDLHQHRMTCANAPCARCPLGTCCFVGPMAELLDHFITLHELPLTAEDRAGKSFGIDLLDGFNVVSTTVRDGADQHLLLLNVVRQPFGRGIAAVCVRPPPAATASSSSSSAAAASKTVVLELRYSVNRHYQESAFDVPFADLADGFLEDDESAQFIVPKSVHPDDQATMLLTAFISIK
ncbi:E3 ubiquitin-protein ligase SINA-like 10 [Triticum urartu]|uniref:E3 ubiquitin-protein ligase SINA-like 10 n=1 Tax=Triticum urartu TaxID=4572 RepID=UPI001E20AE6C|nr:E3 ubiquitin-protein ligase SINA-like 10 [Triticum urartu]